MGAWIHMVPLADATGTLKQAYDKVTTPHGTVDNVMRAHSLRPHTMEGHVALYRSVLHHPDNKLPLWFLECVAVATSLLNRCDYSFAHHWTNARKLIRDEARAAEMLQALRDDQPERAFAGKERADVDACRDAGADDGEILEVNQVCAYFNYSNRLLNGLGVDTEGDTVGYYK
jgi:AhpD family alkylhydroperoxidase